MITTSDIKNLLIQAFEGAQVAVQDLTGTQDHYKVSVVSEKFSGLTLVKRHQLINTALAEPLKGPLHALSIEALTPDEAKSKTPTSSPRGIEF